MTNHNSSHENNNASVEYAGFWMRVGASVIDLTIVNVLLRVIILPVLWKTYGEVFSRFFGEEVTDFLISWILTASAVVIFWVYKQATPGKMLVKAKILDAQTGGKPSTGQCIVRYLAYLVSALPVGLGFIWVAFDKRKQSWHDKLAGTVVVHDRRKPNPVPSSTEH